MSAITPDNSPSSTTFYTSMYNEKNEIIMENVFTNSLNILGYIPGISVISGIARIAFGHIMLLYTRDDDHNRINHYQNHIKRGLLEYLPIPILVNNLILITSDITTSYLKHKNTIVVPKVKTTENLYQI